MTTPDNPHDRHRCQPINVSADVLYPLPAPGSDIGFMGCDMGLFAGGILCYFSAAELIGDIRIRHGFALTGDGRHA